VLATYVIVFLVGAPEWRVRRRERGRGTAPKGDSSPPLRSDIVKMWMASAERARKSLAGEPVVKNDR